jgi:DNA-binding NtrC family response regulator
MLTAESAQQAREMFARHRPHAVLLDYLLGDDDGVAVSLEFLRQAPQTQVIMMTGGILSPEEEAICQEHDIPILRKPFFADHVLDLIRARLFRSLAPVGNDITSSDVQGSSLSS